MTSRWALMGMLLLAAGCTSAPGLERNEPPKSAGMQLTVLRDSEPVACICVDVADTEAERNIGLTGSGDPAPFDGLAFLWDAPTLASFWMKDTAGPLDVVFVAENNVVVDVQTMQECVAEPCPVFASSGLTSFAVEVPVAALVPIRPGDTAILAGVCQR